MEKKISRNDDINGRTVTMYNFIDEIKPLGAECENYVLYFGRYSEEREYQTLSKRQRNLVIYRLYSRARANLKMK